MRYAAVAIPRAPNENDIGAFVTHLREKLQ